MIKVADLKDERTKWLQTLEQMLQDNIYMKNRLAEIIKDDITAASLEKAEYYHNELLHKDAVIALLRYDIIKQNKINVTDLNENAVSQKHEKLRNDMQMMEVEFARLRNEFNAEF
eukprot:TRINITY_DN32694_c0_g1_i1.p1 TRINITY_DN32694_c0_g1~~TRINITY_DN32694_c0_g1_i1.p1  ORF type:complete len:115 (+),score=29.14 TRINITY_DN32694_c0_g1_i1:94-438(+)